MTESNTPSIDAEKVAASFDKAANDYHHTALLQQEIGERLVERLADISLNATNIVDLGCGTGFVMQKLAQYHPKSQIFGVDIARHMLQQAQKHAPRWFSNQHFICANAEFLPFADNSIDLVISNLMLQWCGDFTAVLKECQRVLSPKGVLLFSTLGPDTLKELRESWAQVDKHHHVNEFVNIYQLGDALFNLGMKDPVMDIDWITECDPDGMDIMRQVKIIGAHHVNAGRAKGLRGKQGLQKMLNYYEKFRITEGLPATYEVIYGMAWKKTGQPKGDYHTYKVDINH